VNRIGFSWEIYEYGMGSDEGLAIEIDGTSLIELAAAVEEPYALAGGNPQLAGAYAGLSRFTLKPEEFERHLFGMPVLEPDDGSVVLLGCNCGDWGCWPLSAQIRLERNTVRWSDFRNWHRDWDLSALGPFVFDREQYETAVRQVAEA